LRQQADNLAAALLDTTGLRRSNHAYAGWLGLECPSVAAAVWMMRTMVGTNVLSRREGTTLFVPVNPVTDPQGALAARAVGQVYGLARAQAIL
jgi:hypothetical protein